MTPDQVRQHFARIEQSVSRAATACETADGVSGVVRNQVAQWNQACQRARDTVDRGGDPDRIRACIAELEVNAKRTLEVCRADDLEGSLEEAVARACDVIGELKHGLA